MKLRDLICQGEKKLANTYPVEQAKYETKLLTIRIMNWERWQLREHLNDTLPQTIIIKLSNAFEKRSRGIPIAYILEVKEFFSLEFYVNKYCLIPRPESEDIVNLAISHSQQMQNPPNKIFSLLDLGTGSGCLAISCLCNIDNCHAWVTDIEQNCLFISRKNAVTHQVSNRIHFWCGNWNTAINPEIKFDCIISNPPYLSLAEITNELVHEPVSALNGGNNGLEPYIYLLQNLGSLLSKEGCFIFEYNNKYQSFIDNQLCINNWLTNKTIKLGNITILKVSKNFI